MTFVSYLYCFVVTTFMFNKAVFPGKYIQGAGALNALPELSSRYAGKVMLIGSESVRKNYLTRLVELFGPNSLHFEKFGGECSIHEIERLVHIARISDHRIVIGMGGGKVMDTAKAVAGELELPVIVVPTAASSDAPCSGLAVVYTDEGMFEKVIYQKNNPAAVVVDMEIIAQSPPRLLVAGMGDGLSTWFEAEACQRTRSPNECGGLSTITAVHLARLCYDTIIKFGLQAKLDCENQLITPALEMVTEANTLLSGIGFESSGLAAAHAIHNGLTVLHATKSYYHGEKVAFGTLAGLHLSGASEEQLREAYGFCECVGLPTTLSGLGLGNINPTQLMAVAIKSCEPNQSIHHEEKIINAEKVFDALILADNYGKRRQAN